MFDYGRNRIAAAARNYRTLRRTRHTLENIRRNSDLGRVYDGFYHQFPLSLVVEPINALPRLLLRQSRYRYRTQRPRFYLPGLEAKPWWPSDANSSVLVANSDIIAKEFEKIASKIENHSQGYLIRKGSWLTFNLFRNGKIEENCRLCPETTEIVESLPLCEQASGNVYFSVMMPGTHVNPHCGPLNTRIRYHLTLSHDEQAWMRVDAEKRTWKDRECLVFDDSFEHEVQHLGHLPRAVLLVDCWHPALSALEREWIERLFVEIGSSI
jgi:Aspartyl/Asparaginyl beta-hydroxylase